MKKLLLILLTIITFSVNAQFDPNYKEKEKSSPFNLGLGTGVDYGGIIGARLSGFPIKYFGAFVAGGYNLHKIAYNFGGVVRILPDKKVCPVLMGMYGYNAVIVVQGASQYNETYYGPSFGGGIELHFGNRENYMNIELLVPIRPQEFYDDLDALKQNPTIEISEPAPISLSIGYHFRLEY